MTPVQQRVVVIGGGMAGARFARQLTGTGVDLTLVGEEPHAAYNRVLLAGVLAGQYPAEVIALPPADGARWLRGVRAARIDRDAREVGLDDGTVLPYDALVLATGSNPVLPPLRGLFTGDDRELPAGVHAFRTMDDALALAKAAGSGTPAVVIGGGLLGVSAARALAARGARVVLAHQGEYLMERQLDPEASTVLRQHMEALGVEVHSECRVRGLNSRPAAGPGPRRSVSGVEPADGYGLDAELVVLACGVRPRTGLARDAGLTVARGIVVDDELRTSDPRIFAIGDCAEHDGVLYGLAAPAQEQADALAGVLTAPAAAAHPGPAYSGTRSLTRLTLAAPGAGGPAFDGPVAPGRLPDPPEAGPLDLAAFGETTPRPDDDVIRLADATRSVYRKVVVRGDRLVGGILLGDLGTVGALARTWEGNEALPSAPLLHLLTDDGGS